MEIANRFLSPKRDWLVIFLVVTFFAIYAAMHGNFRKESIDDPWVISWIYNYVELGLETDYSFRPGFPGTGLSSFGKTMAFIYGPILQAFDWNQDIAHLISTIFMLGSAIIWYFLFSNVFKDKRLSIISVLIMFMLEPFVFVSNLARADALTFFIASLSFYLFVRERYLFSGLLTVIGFETHPMGIMSLVYIGTFVIYRWRFFLQDKESLMKKAIFFFVGSLLGIFFYILLHHKGMNATLSTIESGRGSVFVNYLYFYFFQVKYYRHIPELLIIIFCLILYFSNKQIPALKFVCLFVSIGVLSTFLIRRSTPTYVIYIYPAFIMLIMHVFHSMKKVHWITACYLCLLIPQYGFAYYKFHNYDLSLFVKTVKESIPDDGLPVLGNPNAWYAFRERNFRAYHYLDGAKMEDDRFYIIENQSFLKAYDRADLISKIKEEYPSKLINTFKINNETINVYFYSRNEHKSEK